MLGIEYQPNNTKIIKKSFRKWTLLIQSKPQQTLTTTFSIIGKGSMLACEASVALYKEFE